MKLIACLTILSLILAFSSTGPAGPKISTDSEGYIALEQLHGDPSPIPHWWCRDLWVERVFPPRRRRRRKRRRRHRHKHSGLALLLRRFRRWRRQRRRPRRPWQRLMDGTVQAQKATAPDPPTVCTGEACATVAPGEAGQQAPVTPAPPAEVVEEAHPTTRRGPGRPRTIPTAHKCCPNEECPAYDRLGDDPLHDIVGCGTYTAAHGEVRQMYRCNVCGRLFSETAGTPFFGLKTPMQTVCIALQELAEGLGIRAVARIHGVKPDTVLEWLKKAGQHCQMLSGYMMRELHVSQVQLDELWTFVRKKERTLKAWEKLHGEWGDTWVWVAFDPVHKLVIAVLVGERTEEEAVRFVARLRARLAEACRPLRFD